MMEVAAGGLSCSGALEHSCRIEAEGQERDREDDAPSVVTSVLAPVRLSSMPQDREAREGFKELDNCTDNESMTIPASWHVEIQLMREKGKATPSLRKAPDLNLLLVRLVRFTAA